MTTMRQLTLPIGHAARPTFDNFTIAADDLLVGANDLALAQLKALRPGSAPVYLWGASGAGKTHLLHALADAARARGEVVAFFTASRVVPWPFDEAVSLILLDDCDRFDAQQQQAAFALFVEATSHGVPIAAAGRVPPTDLPLRDDLRSRLGWGLVLAIAPLPEAQSRAALRRDAERRGLDLPDDVIDFLMRRFERDLKHLIGLLDQLDAYALTTRRAITVPMVRKMLAEKADE
jgi:DnaA family protein